MGRDTHFGSEKVSFAEKTQRVQDVFRRVASKYDLMNDLMSLGIHRLWKDRLVGSLDLPRNGRILDCAGGTGDIAVRLTRTWPHLNCEIIVCDLTFDMISVGRDRAINQGILHPIKWLCGTAENLPFSDNAFDLYIIAYGLRNVARIDSALAEAFRVLKPGGRFLCLEFSHLAFPPLQKLYDLYSFSVLPLLGKWVANDRAAYEYLAESIRQFPSQESLTGMIEAGGFSSPRWQNLCGGISCIHEGVKSRDSL